MRVGTIYSSSKALSEQGISFSLLFRFTGSLITRLYTSNSLTKQTIITLLPVPQGHDIIGYTPRPQQAVAWSAQMLAHGAAGILFLRYRAAVFGQEEVCYGILDHATPRATGRKFQEAKQVRGSIACFTPQMLEIVQA